MLLYKNRIIVRSIDTFFSVNCLIGSPDLKLYCSSASWSTIPTINLHRMFSTSYWVKPTINAVLCCSARSGTYIWDGIDLRVFLFGCYSYSASGLDMCVCITSLSVTERFARVFLVHTNFDIGNDSAWNWSIGYWSRQRPKCTKNLSVKVGCVWIGKRVPRCPDRFANMEFVDNFWVQCHSAELFGKCWKNWFCFVWIVLLFAEIFF